MAHTPPLPRETLEVCVVESAGDQYAVPEHNVIGVLTPDDDAALRDVCGLLALEMDERYRPLISLRSALCLPPASAENVVVVLRIGAQLFGLLVDKASEPTRVEIHPTMTDAPALATFSHLTQRADGTVLPVLNPTSLAVWARHPEPIRALQLAA
jgi:chemotaxis protein histidine kinase CheA